VIGARGAASLSLCDQRAGALLGHGGSEKPEKSPMKKIEAVIRRIRLDAVRDALRQHGLLHGMTLADVRGVGSEQGREIMYRGNACPRPFVPRVKLEIVTPDDEAELVVTCILDAAYTGEPGDGKILVTSVESVFRIRTGEEVTDVCLDRRDDEPTSLWREAALRPSF